MDKILIVLSAASGGVSIIFFYQQLNSCSCIFFKTGIIKQILSTIRKKKKKHVKILALAKSKLNSIETFVPQALIDIAVSHEEFITISNEKDKYVKMREDMKQMKSRDGLNKEKGNEIKEAELLVKIKKVHKIKNAYF